MLRKALSLCLALGMTLTGGWLILRQLFLSEIGGVSSIIGAVILIIAGGAWLYEEFSPNIRGTKTTSI